MYFAVSFFLFFFFFIFLFFFFFLPLLSLSTADSRRYDTASLAYWVLLLTCKQTGKIDQINVIVRHQYKIHFKANLNRNIVHTVHTFLITQISTIRSQFLLIRSSDFRLCGQRMPDQPVTPRIPDSGYSL